MAVRKSLRSRHPAEPVLSIPHSSWSRRDAVHRQSALKPEEFWARLGE